MTKPLSLDDLAAAGREAYCAHEKIDIVSWSDSALRKEWAVIARAILTTIHQAGYRIVPVEATDGMILRGIVERHGSDVPEAWSLATKNIWQAMLSAAPMIMEE